MNDKNKLKRATRAKIARTELRALKFYSSRPLSYFGTGQGSDFGDLLGAFCLGLGSSAPSAGYEPSLSLARKA